MSLPITSLLAGIFSLMMIPLSLQVSMRRFKTGIADSSGADDLVLRRRIRAHGNFIEYAPTALIALGLIEYGGATTFLVYSLAAAFLGSRLLHALGMLYASGPALRGAGMLIQHAAFLVAGSWLVLKAW